MQNYSTWFDIRHCKLSPQWSTTLHTQELLNWGKFEATGNFIAC